MHRTPGAESPAPPDDIPPDGTTFMFDGKPYVVGVDVVVGAFTTQPAEDSDEDRPSGKTLTLSVEHLLQGPPHETRATLDEAPHLRRSNGVVRHALCRARPIGGRTGRHEARPARAATRREGASSATSSSDPPPDGDDSDPEPSEEGLCTCGCRPAKPRRFCACGCRREITHRRADAKTFGASCRQRIARAATGQRFAPDEAKRCRCESGWFFRDAEGDAVCGLCGCWLAKVAHPPGSHELIDALMRANGVYVRPRPLSKPWDDTQAAYRRRETVS